MMRDRFGISLLGLLIVPFLVHVKTADPSRSGVEVFIRTPYCEIDVPVM